MATFVLLHGAGSDSWYWHRVEPELRAGGHDVVAVDLPCDDDSAGLAEYADAVVRAVGRSGGAGRASRPGRDGMEAPAGTPLRAGGRSDQRMQDRPDVVLVAQSMAGFVAPLVCERVPVRLMVLVAAMVPAPNESPGEWWANTGHRFPADDLESVFLHDVPPEVAAESAEHTTDQSGTPFEKPWPLQRWPDVPTRFLLCRDDRFFPADFQRRVVRERLGIVPDEMDGGHLPALARPKELAERLIGFWNDSSRGAVAPK